MHEIVFMLQQLCLLTASCALRSVARRWWFAVHGPAG
jgi:hypothetical protein